MELSGIEELTFAGIGDDMAEAMWPKVEPLIQDALAHANGELNSDDMKKAILARDMQLFVLYNPDSREVEVAGVTEIINYPRKKVCRVVAMGGGPLEAWNQGIEEVQKWAYEFGCDGMEAFARPGVEKIMGKNFGYRKYYSVIGFDFKDTNNETQH